MMNFLLFNGHQGVGDWVVCVGAVNKLSLKYDKIIVPVAPTAYSSVVELFYPNRKIQVVEDESAVHGGVTEARTSESMKEKFPEVDEIITVGHHGNPPLDAGLWDRSMYEQAGVNFEESWNSFTFRRDYHKENELIIKFYKQKNLKFLHDDPTRRHCIRNEYRDGYYVYPDRKITSSVTHYAGILQRCTEIHCIPSSFSLFVDRIPLPLQPKLYLHVYARMGGMLPTYRKDWIYL